MRLAVCVLSAVLLSGCSWLGFGSHKSYETGHNFQGASYGGGCGVATQAYDHQTYGYTASQAAQGYNTACNSGYGIAQATSATAYGQAGYNQQAGYTQNQYAHGQTGYNQFGYNSGGTTQHMSATTLGTSAPYGSAVGGSYNASNTHISGGQYVNGAYVQNVVGAPIYVAQPYTAYHGSAGASASAAASASAYSASHLRGGSFEAGALPFGLELGVGTSFDIGGDIYTEKPAGPAKDAFGNPSPGRTVSIQPAVSYKDAWDNAISYDVAATYDLNRSTTAIARLGYSKADGKDFALGEATEGGVTAPVTGRLSDLEQYTIEGGIRKYAGNLGNNYTGLRPYVGVSGGFTHTNDIELTQTSTAFANGTETQSFSDASWSPTASGVIGAEYQVGARTAIGLETGIRWTDNVNTNLTSKDRWQVPVKLRGRISF